MNISISSTMKVYIFTPGRGIHALERVVEAATALGLTVIVTRAAGGIVFFRAVMDLQARYRTSRTGLYGPYTVELDNLLDRGLTSVDAYLEGQIRLFSETHPRAGAASAIRPALFPEGVAAITGQPFVHQRVSVDRLIEAYLAPPLAPARAELPDLDVMMVRVAELNREYGVSIDDYDRDRPNLDTLRAAQQTAQESLAETFVLCLAAYLQAPPDQRAAFAALLEPIMRQNELIRSNRRRRKPPVDIDPGTGLDLPEEPELPATPA
jgi:hypothetical protein